MAAWKKGGRVGRRQAPGKGVFHLQAGRERCCRYRFEVEYRFNAKGVQQQQLRGTAWI
jgi:hypothetical protein